MAEIDKSIKLVFNEFQRSISEVPLEVYYQTLNADQFNAAGYQFNIKQPGVHALLDTDIWVEFNLRIKETANNTIKGMFEGSANGAWVPISDNKLALRSGYVVQRVTQNFSLQINNQTLNTRPGYFVDVMNRLHISNDQSEHEFCTSGGRFDEGNHGHRVCNPLLGNPTYGLAAGNGIVNDTSYSTQKSNLQLFTVNDQQAADGNMHLPVMFSARDSYRGEFPLGTATAFPIYGWTEYPNMYEFTNPGFDNRFGKFLHRIRQNLDYLDANGTANNAAPGAMIVGYLQNPSPGANQRVFNIKVWERLPISIFKQYSNDGVFGVIPNIVQMQIQGNFVNNMQNLLLSSNVSNIGVDMYWTDIQPSMCKIFLRWYTAPKTMNIPREIHIPYPKIITWSATHAILNTNTAGTVNYVDNDEVGEYNISIEAIPDLLLIYMRLQAGSYTFDTPDDFNMEINNLMINIDNASGKLNQINSLDLYNKWKRLLKHSDNKIIGYEEWRRYCCVACLQPEDYGVRYGPGYSNPCVLGIRFRPRNWHINPSIHCGPPRLMGAVPANGNREFLGGAQAGVVSATPTLNTELVVTQIFYKNKLIIRADGTCNQELLKIAADFDMTQPDQGMVGVAGSGTLNA